MSEYGKQVKNQMDTYMNNPDSIDKEISDIQNATHGVEVRGALAAGVKKSFNKSVKAETTSNSAQEQVGNIQNQVDQLVIEGDSSVEAAQARVDAEGNIYDTLKDRLDFSDRREENVDKNSFYRGLTMTKEKKAQLVFVDDDCRQEVWTLLKPIVEQENIPISIAAITQYPDTVDGTGNWLSLEQLKELQKVGFEVVSHTHTHKALGEISDEEVHYELATSKAWLKKRGFNHNILVYPYGSFGGKQHIVSQYYQAAIRTDYGEHLLNRPPVLQMQLERVYYNYQDGTNDIETCKQKIDEAIDNNELLIIGMHCHYDGFDSNGLIEIIQYAKLRGIEIVTAQEAINSYGNYIDLPDFKIGSDGEIHSNSLGTYKETPSNYYNGTTPLTDFPLGKTTRTIVTGDYQGLPTSNSGVLVTHRFSSSDYHSYQDYIRTSNKNVWRRRWVGGEWQEWYRLNLDIFNRDREYRIETIQPHSCKEFPTTDQSLYNGENLFIYKVISKLPVGIIYQNSTDEDGGGNTTYHQFCNVTSNPIEVGTAKIRETEIRGL